jgi:prepilin-type N-terminal cleavage/methylation domain-containing protein
MRYRNSLSPLIAARRQAAPGPRRHRREAPRGFSLLELSVAMALFGIAMMGLLPVVVMYTRGVTALERRSPIEGQWYLAPSADTWARKLGASASLTAVDPGPKPPPPVLIDDDGDPGYTQTSANWELQTGLPPDQAFQNDRSRHAPLPEGSTPSGTDNAVWTFTNIVPGWYQVEATWLESPDQTDAAHYSVYDGGALLSETSFSQRIAPVGPLYGSRPWQIVTTQYVRSGTAQVKLSGESTAGYVVADGLQLVPIENNVQVLSLQKSLGSEEVTVHVSVQQIVPHP